MIEETTVGHSVNVCRADILKALKTIALKRLREKGVAVDDADWYESAEVFLPESVTEVPVNFARR